MPARDNQDFVEVWRTSGDGKHLLEKQVPLAVTDPSNDSRQAGVVIRQEERFQPLVGMGAALTDAAAYALWHHLDKDRLDKVLVELFDHTSGIGLSALRVPMGASDFAASNYTYDDRPWPLTDWTLKHFSIEHDRAYILPILKRSLEINPELAVIASPWTAPGWMKRPRWTRYGVLKRQYYGLWADYYVAFIKAYEAAGVPIHAVTAQNEPKFGALYPTMKFSADDQRSFIGQFLGPALAKAGLSTKILAYDHNWDDLDYPGVILDDPEARRFVHGTAWHGYAGSVDAQTRFQEKYPDKAIYFTEVTGSQGSSFGGDLIWQAKNILVGATRNHARTVLFWNLALDQRNGPTNGHFKKGRGVVTVNDDATVERNVEYYVLGHGAKFIRPGAVRVGLDIAADNVSGVAFRNPEGDIVLILVSAGREMQQVRIRMGATEVELGVDGREVITMVWPART